MTTIFSETARHGDAFRVRSIDGCRTVEVLTVGETEWFPVTTHWDARGAALLIAHDLVAKWAEKHSIVRSMQHHPQVVAAWREGDYHLRLSLTWGEERGSSDFVEIETHPNHWRSPRRKEWFRALDALIHLIQE